MTVVKQIHLWLDLLPCLESNNHLAKSKRHSRVQCQMMLTKKRMTKMIPRILTSRKVMRRLKMSHNHKSQVVSGSWITQVQIKVPLFKRKMTLSTRLRLSQQRRIRMITRQLVQGLHSWTIQVRIRVIHLYKLRPLPMHLKPFHLDRNQLITQPVDQVLLSWTILHQLLHKI